MTELLRAYQQAIDALKHLADAAERKRAAALWMEAQAAEAMLAEAFEFDGVGQS